LLCFYFYIDIMSSISSSKFCLPMFTVSVSYLRICPVRFGILRTAQALEMGDRHIQSDRGRTLVALWHWTKTIKHCNELWPATTEGTTSYKMFRPACIYLHYYITTTANCHITTPTRSSMIPNQHKRTLTLDSH